MFTTDVFLWLLYGLFIHALPIILTNPITLLFTLAILIMRDLPLMRWLARQEAV